MFYQEKIINGILHFRNSPKGKWIEMTKEQLTKIITRQNKRIVESDDINELIKAEKENRIKKQESFIPAFEENMKCHFFWFQTS